MTRTRSKPVIVHHGMPGHFIGSPDCCFHMHTTVRGKWRVSTVGCYHPASEREGRKTGPAREIGYQRLFETMVFPVKRGRVDYTEVDMCGYKNVPEAEAGHAAMVAKYARKR